MFPIHRVTRQMTWPDIPMFLKGYAKFVVGYIVKSLSIINKAETDVFLELPWLFHYPLDVSTVTSSAFASSESNLHIWRYFVYVLLKSELQKLLPSISCMMTHISFAFQNIFVHIENIFLNILKIKKIFSLNDIGNRM